MFRTQAVLLYKSTFIPNNLEISIQPVQILEFRMKPIIMFLILAICIVLPYIHFKSKVVSDIYTYFRPKFVSDIYDYFRPDKSPYRSVEKASALILGDALKDSKHKPRITLLGSRAGPNQRLVNAFGVDNAFTTTDERYHQTFRNRVVGLVKKDQQWWDTAASFALTQARSGIDKSPIKLVPHVQAVTFKVVLYALFGKPRQEPDISDIEKVTKLINTLWLASKSCGSNPEHDRSLLETSLSQIIPLYEHPPVDNPMNLILPAYETMWRVVLRCWLEVSFRGGSGDPDLQTVLEGYSAHPTFSNFDDQNVFGISCKWIAMEALRLYPPTRRIYRMTIDKRTGDTKIEAADIEYLHRDPTSWGRDSYNFRPRRWQQSGDNPRGPFMAFGLGKFTCPARPEFGPRMIVNLVAALVVTFKTGWTLRAEETMGDPMHGGKPLNLDRDALESLKLCRQET